MLVFWNAISVALYLLPLGLVFVWRGRIDREPWRAATDACCTVSLDLLGVALIARVVTLEHAVLTSRVLWLAAGAFLIHRDRASIGEWARSIDLRRWAAPALCGSVAVWCSTIVSGRCAVWDREWHIPLAASMRGQHTPFFNVYEPTGALYYHYFGDVLAVMLQTLSFAHVHSSAALSRMHDVLVGLTGLVGTSLLSYFGLKRSAWPVVVTLACLLGGPATILLSGDARPQLGRSIVNLFSLSYRPHTSLAYLLILGFVAALFLPLLTRERSIAPRETRTCLFSCTAALVLTDETSLALLGLMFAVVWIVSPSAVARTRRQGAVVGAVLLLAIAAVILICGGTFMPGQPGPSLRLLPYFRVPGYLQPSLPLSTPAGFFAFFADYCAPLSVCLVGAIVAILIRNSVVVTMFSAYFAITVVGLWALTRLEINAGSLESHRFVTVALFLAPVFAFYFCSLSSRVLRSEGARSFVALMAGTGIFLPVASTSEWLFGLSATICKAYGMDNYAGVDCGKFAGARTGDEVTIAYVDTAEWYRFAGCRPIRAPTTQPDTSHQIAVGRGATGVVGLKMLDEWVKKGPLTAFCAARSTDPVCISVQKLPGACRKESDSFERCSLGPDLRRTLLRGPL
jgi:hypothetical protein